MSKQELTHPALCFDSVRYGERYMVEFYDSQTVGHAKMPIHDYRCKQCAKRSSHFFRSFSEVSQPDCPHCGSSNVVRLLSKFAVHQSWDSGINIPSQETMSDFDENDPDSMRSFVEGMRRDMGDDWGHDFDEFIAEAETERTASDGLDY